MSDDQSTDQPDAIVTEPPDPGVAGEPSVGQVGEALQEQAADEKPGDDPAEEAT